MNNNVTRRTVRQPSTQILALLAVAAIAANPAFGAAGGNPGQSRVAPEAVPGLTAMFPATSYAGASAQTLTLRGSNFVAGTTVGFNGVSRAAQVISDSHLTAELTTAELAQAGSFAVNVTTPGSGGGTSASRNFTVTSLAFGERAISTPDWTADTHGKLKTSDIEANFSRVFDNSQVQRLDITVEPSHWAVMQSNLNALKTQLAGTPNFSNLDDPIYVPSTVQYNGKQWYRVGLRFKGNSSLYSANSNKLPFKLKFNEFEGIYPAINGQRFYGFKSLSLKNNFKDESQVHELVGNQLFRDFGLKGAHSAYYKLYLDFGSGPVYFGMYTLVEEVDDTVIKTQYTDDSANLYKPEDNAARFSSGSFNTYELGKKTNESIADYGDAQALYDALNSNLRVTDPSAWKTNLEKILDVPIFLKWLAANIVMQNWDTYGVMTHNYFLYRNPATQRFEWIPWDNNEALITNPRCLTLPATEVTAQWPLIRYLLNDAGYSAQYRQYVREFANGVFNAARMVPIYSSQASLIQDAVLSEIAGYTFTSSTRFPAAIAALKSHVASREAAALAFAGPEQSTTTTTTTTTTVLVTTTTISTTTSTTARPTTTTTTTVLGTTTTSSTTTTTVPGATRLLFPMVLNGAGQSTGLAVVNPTNAASSLGFKAYSNSGALLATAQRTLEPRRQLAQVFKELFPAVAEAAAWLVMDSSVPDVAGMFLLFDDAVTWMDGTDATARTFTDFVISLADSLEISLVNPTASPATYQLDYLGEAGNVLGSVQGSLAANGRAAIPGTSLRPTGTSAGYVRGHSSSGVVALATLGSTGWLGTLAAVDVSAPYPTVQYAPQFAAGGGLSSSLHIVNLESSAQMVTLTFIGDSGQVLGTPATVSLTAAGSTQVTGVSLFGLTSATELIQGYVRLESSVGRFTGSVRFTDPQGQVFGTALGFVGAGQTAAQFSHVAQNDLYFTGLATLNPNAQPVAVTVEVYRADGTLVAAASQQVPARGRFSKLLPQLVGPFAAMTTGYFNVSASQPVASFALFGTTAGDVLAAIPALVLQAPSPTVHINEVESNGGTPGDWVEIINTGASSVDISGWRFLDNDDTHTYSIPAGTSIAAGGYYLLEEAAFGFGLGAADSARLFNATGGLVDSHTWTAHAGTTYGRCPNGTGAFATTTGSTKGAANTCPATTVTALP